MINDLLKDDLTLALEDLNEAINENSSIEDDFENEDTRIKEINNNEEVVDEALEVIDNLEEYISLIESKEDFDYYDLKYMIDYNKLIQSKYNIKSNSNLPKLSFESYENYSSYEKELSKEMALEELNASFEGIISWVASKIWGAIKFLITGLKDAFDGSIKDYKRLVKIEASIRSLDGQGSSRFLANHLFKINGKHEPLQVLKNAHKLYEEEVLNKKWLIPVKGGFKVLENLPDKLKGLDDPNDIVQITQHELKQEIDSKLSNIWKKTSQEYEDTGLVLYSYSISDAIKVHRPNIDPMNKGLIGGTYSWNMQRRDTPEGESVPSCDINTYLEIKKLYGEYLDSFRGIIRDIEEIGKELEENAKRLQLLFSKARGKGFHAIQTVALGLFSFLALQQGLSSAILGAILKFTSNTEDDTKDLIDEKEKKKVKDATDSIIGSFLVMGLLGIELGVFLFKKLKRRMDIDDLSKYETKIYDALDKKSKKLLPGLVRSVDRYTSSVTKSIVLPYGRLLRAFTSYALSSV